VVQTWWHRLITFPSLLSKLLLLSYSKWEGLDAVPTTAQSYTFLLISAADYTHYNKTHKLIGKAEGFSRLAINPREFPPVKIVLRDQILLLMRRGCGNVAMATDNDTNS